MMAGPAFLSRAAFPLRAPTIQPLATRRRHLLFLIAQHRAGKRRTQDCSASLLVRGPVFPPLLFADMCDLRLEFTNAEPFLRTGTPFSRRNFFPAFCLNAISCARRRNSSCTRRAPTLLDYRLRLTRRVPTDEFFLQDAIALRGCGRRR